MPDDPETIQHGATLSRAIVAAFRAKGTSLTAWCTENDVHRENVRQAAFGVWSGKKGKELLDRVIDAAGRDMVEMICRQGALETKPEGVGQ